jgi:hypothetical protein
VTRRVGLLEACRDPSLIGVTPWPRQAEILAQIDSGMYREIVLALGRRSGKSLMAAVVGLHDAAFRDLTAYLRPGERRHVIVVAASREQAGVILQYVRELVAGSLLLREAVESDVEDAVTIRQPATGAIVAIRTLPCSSRAGRGHAISTLICDELAFWISEGEGPAIADRVYGSLTPSLAQFQAAGRIICISTPWGLSNLFAKLFERATSGQHPDMLAVTAPTWEMNPTLTQAFFDSERAKDPELFRGEYGAEFLASGAMFLDYERVMAAVDCDRFELPPGEVIAPIAAFDASFARDPAALAIVGRVRDVRNRLRLALVRYWRPTEGELGFTALLEEVARICLDHGVHRIVVDQFCSVPVREFLRGRGVFAEERTMSATSKTAIFGALKSRLYSGGLELYGHAELLSELGRVEAHYGTGGGTIRLPRTGNSHCDMAMAVAMAVAEFAGVSRGPDVWAKHEHDPGMVGRSVLSMDLGSGRRATRKPRWYDQTGGPRF